MESRGQSSARRPPRPGKRGRRLAALFLVAAVAAGCTRPFYRDKADREVEEILREKDQYPAWKIEQFHVYPDPRARFGDPTDPDHPPMPPDDQAAFEQSPRSQKPGKAGIQFAEGTGYLDLLALWDGQNRVERKAREGEDGAVEPTAAVAPAKDGDKPALPAGVQPAAPTPAAGTCDPAGRQQPFLLKMEQASELGLVNSREFQDQREDLYL